MTTITTRAGKGSPLTNNEVDANFTNLSNDNQPDVRPSLLLDFANSKTLDPRITFTRGSTATYWDGKTTTKAEENLFTHSQDIVAGKWNIIQLGVVDDQTAPDGTSTAQLFTPNTSSNYHYVYAGNSPTTTATSTFSVYAKNNGANYAFLRSNSSSGYCGVNFDLSNSGSAAVEGSGNIDSYSATDVGNGWYRLTVTFNKNLSSQTQLLINGDSSSVAEVWTGNGTDGIYFWGAQLEQRSSATAYTPTTSSPIVKYQPTLQTAASGEARFDHDPVTGESKGLLIEEARTNLIKCSSPEDTDTFGTNGWQDYYGFRAYRNTVVAPDGTQTAATVRAVSGGATTGASMYVNNPIVIPSTATYTYSVYLKKGGERPMNLVTVSVFGNGNASGSYQLKVDLTDGTVNTLQSGTAVIEDVGNGWYRCSITQSLSAGNKYPQVGSYGNATLGSTFLMWGAQMELGHGASSYIPTSGSTVTRSADDASIALTNEVSLQEATVYAEAATYRAYAAETAWCPVWQLNDGVSTANGVFDVRAFQQTYGSMAVVRGVGQSSFALLNDGQTVTNGEFYKYGLFWNQGSVSFYKNGAGIGASTNQYVNPVFDSLDIGWADRGGRRLDGHLKKLAVYPQALSHNTMLAMTEE